MITALDAQRLHNYIIDASVDGLVDAVVSSHDGVGHRKRRTPQPGGCRVCADAGGVFCRSLWIISIYRGLVVLSHSMDD